MTPQERKAKVQELRKEHENYFHEKQKLFDFYDQYGLSYAQGYKTIQPRSNR